MVESEAGQDLHVQVCSRAGKGLGGDVVTAEGQVR